MARKWGWRLIAGGLMAGGVYAGALQLGLAPAILGADARQQPVAAMPAAEPGPRPVELAPIEVTEVAPTSMNERLRVSGELRPVNRVALKAKVGGTVLAVNAREGQQVRSGDVLIRFETDDLQSTLVQRDSNLEAARAQLRLAEQTLDKTRQLAERGFATRAALERAESDAAAALANVQGLSAQSDTARTALRDAEIVAPFDGIVARRSVEPGAPASPNAELMTIVDTAVLEAEVLVSTRDVARLRIGQVAELQVDGLEGRPIVGTVDRINPVANEGSRFVPVHIRLENTDGRLWGGMFATGSILIRESADILVLPATSLREDLVGSFVLKLADGRLVRQPVTAGDAWSGGLVEIVEGIRPGDTVVTAPLDLEPEMRVVISRAG